MKGEGGKVEGAVRALSEEMSDLKVALNEEDEERKQESIAMESRMESKIVNQRKIEEKLNSIKEDIKSLRMGRGGTLSSAASSGYGLGSGTFAQPPSLAVRWKSEWVPRKFEIKGWITDWEKHIQGIQDDEAKKIMNDICSAMVAEVKANIKWEHSKENQGPWPRKTMVNLLFIQEIRMMIETLRNLRKVLTDRDYNVNGEVERASLELSPQKKPMGKAQAMFFNSLFEATRRHKQNLAVMEKDPSVLFTPRSVLSVGGNLLQSTSLRRRDTKRLAGN